eukprot:38400-Eustigmatos_ZCMA.PRE.1
MQFCVAMFLMLRARWAYRSVLTVSSMFESAGLTHAIITYNNPHIGISSMMGCRTAQKAHLCCRLSRRFRLTV